MRPLPVAFATIAVLTLAAPGVAQVSLPGAAIGTTGAGSMTSSAGNTTSSAGATTSSAGSVSSGSIRTPQMGRPDAPLGTTITLSQNIDNAAGLNSNRAIVNGTAGSLPPEANRTTGNTLPGRNALERAGRPAGAPLGSGTVSATPTAGTSAMPADLSDNDPRRTAQ